MDLNPNNRPEAKQLLEHPFITEKSRGKMLLAELSLNCLEQIEEYRKGSESSNNSFADGIIIEGGSIRNLSITNRHDSRNSQIQSVRDPLEGSFIIK